MANLDSATHAVMLQEVMIKDTFGHLGFLVGPPMVPGVRAEANERFADKLPLSVAFYSAWIR